ncbi:MAG: hypothetical protein NTX93_10290 [Bacteroidia bacterium]|nr:hypothetical protein [Bacteroidia bacterium]
MIYSIITFSSSLEEEYPDRSVRGGWCGFGTTSIDNETFLWTFNNPGLKTGIIDNETFVEFSPKSVFLVKILKRLDNCR